MQNNRRRRMSIRPSEGMVKMSRVFGGVFAVIGACFAVLGLTTLIPSGAGLFGIIWTLMALAFVGMGIYGACNKKGMYYMYDFSIEEEGEDVPTVPSGDTTEERLKKLQALYDQRLISTQEFEEKRKEILKEL